MRDDISIGKKRKASSESLAAFALYKMSRILLIEA